MDIKQRIWHFIFLAIVTLAVYYHTLDVPFYLDDFSSIQENPLIYNWQGFSQLWNYAPLRIIGYLSFTLNYYFGKFDYTGYHLINISIHFLVGFILYLFVQVLLKTPRIKVSEQTHLWLPLLTALFFILHPLHIQAVTYIVQRLASLAALFYLLTMFSFVQVRLNTDKKTLWIIICLISALLAFFTKQNTFTLPISLLLIEICFFSSSLKTFLRFGLISVGILSFILVILSWNLNYQPFSLEAMQALTKETDKISRVDYFASQMQVIWVYLKLFFYPSSLHIDYDPFPLVGFDTLTITAALLHLSIIFISLFLMRKYPILTFGILFYYVAHSIESGFIPIRDVIFEHRTYLPDIGLVIIVGWVLIEKVTNWIKLETVLSISCVLLVVLGIQTWQRNEMWRDSVTLWQHNVTLAPNKERAWSVLGKHLLERQQAKEGIQALEKAIELRRKNGKKGIDTVDVVNLIVGFKMLKEYDKALHLTQQVLNQPMTPLLKSKFLINQANIYYEQDRVSEAEQSLRQAIAIYPNDLTAKANLASLLGNRGSLDDAEALYLEVLRYYPTNKAVQENLQNLRKLQGK
jgi:protein O-mannosyl-transferase